MNLRAPVSPRQVCKLVLILVISWPKAPCAAEEASTKIASGIRLEHPDARDQDDLCFWYNDRQPAESLVITSDKKAGLVAVYSLSGELIQRLDVPKPGNIDIRQAVDCQGTLRDLVVVNQRTDGWKLVVFEMDRQIRRLSRLDQHDLLTGPNYGVCLYYSARDGGLHAIITSEDAEVEQYELTIDAERRVTHRKVRHWPLGKCEGAVSDDELGKLYISVEEEGVWEFGAEPDQPAPGKLVIRLGEHGLQSDLEGITLVQQPERQGYLLLSSQGQDRFYAYSRTGDHSFLGTFQVDGVQETDGIDALPRPLGEQFPQGIFGSHTAQGKNPCVVLSSWQAIHQVLTRSR